MPSPHPRPWHRNSEFGPGPRVPLCRERRAQWRARLDLHRRAGRLTALHAEVGRALLRRLAEDGRCDPAHETLATDAGCSARTVRRALEAMASCGLVRWVQRLVRDGWRAAQTSNAYVLAIGEAASIPAARCGGQTVRETRRKETQEARERHTATLAAMLAAVGGPKAAREALAARAAQVRERLARARRCGRGLKSQAAGERVNGVDID